MKKFNVLGKRNVDEVELYLWFSKFGKYAHCSVERKKKHTQAKIIIFSAKLLRVRGKEVVENRGARREGEERGELGGEESRGGLRSRRRRSRVINGHSKYDMNLDDHKHLIKQKCFFPLPTSIPPPFLSAPLIHTKGDCYGLTGLK